MKLIIPALALCCLTGDSVELKTHYTGGQALRIESDASFRIETVDMTITVDGEEREGFGTGAVSNQTRRTVLIDRVVESKDGSPTKLHRHFEELSAKSSMSFGDQEQEQESEGPLADVVLELSVEDDEVSAEVLEGGSVDSELLEGHRLELAIAALLPEGELSEGDQFELEGELLIRALEADLSQIYFPPPARDGEGEGGRGRRGMRGRPADLTRLLQSGDWSVEGTLEALEGELDGTPCIVLALEVTGDGVLPEPERGGGRGGRGGRALAAPAPLLATNFDLSAEGKLYYSLEARRPLALELEGELTIESERTRSRGESEMVMTSLQEGSFSHRVSISVIEEEAGD